MKKIILISFFIFWILNVQSQSSISLNGTTDYISVQDKASLDISGDFTIEAWIKPNDISGEKTILIKGNNGQCGNYGLFIKDGNLAFVSGGDCNWAVSRGPNSALQIGEWQHVAATSNGNNVSLFINGALTDTLVRNAAAGPINNDELWIGRSIFITTNFFFNGLIDEVRIWNVAKSQTDIQSIMNTELSGLESYLLLYYKLDAINEECNVSDCSINENHGSRINIDNNTSLPQLINDYPSNLTNVECGVEFVYCGSFNNVTSIPDPNFEQALIDLYIDSDGIINGQVLTRDISSLTTLNVNNKNITDLTGIEDFVSLTDLICYFNNLTSVDVSNNTALIFLDIGYNNLSSLNVSNNIALKVLLCHYNNLSNLNVDNNTSLERLDCYRNNLSSIDVSNNTGLNFFDIGYNNLSSLNVSNNTDLKELLCHYNNLSSLNVNNNSALERLFCYNNNLNNLYVKNGNNSNLIDFNATNNAYLTCIEVDNPDYSATNWLNIDPQTSFSEDCISFASAFQLFVASVKSNLQEGNANSFLNDEANIIEVIGKLQNYYAARSQLVDEYYDFLAELCNEYPQFFKINQIIDDVQFKYLGSLREQVHIYLRDYLRDYPEKEPQFLSALDLSNSNAVNYLEIWNDYGILIIDNYSLDETQLNVVNTLLSTIPDNTTNLGVIMFREFYTDNYVNALYITQSVSFINSFGWLIGTVLGDAFPADFQPFISDGFPIALSHEICHTIDFDYVRLNPRLNNWKNSMLSASGTTYNEYLRTRVLDVGGNDFFQVSPQEFFASLANIYFSNSAQTLELAIERFNQGYKQPINQFLLMLDVLSSESNSSQFYTIDENSNIDLTLHDIERNTNGYISKLYLTSTCAVEFAYDANNYVTSMIVPDLSSTNCDTALGIVDNSSNQNVKIYPNPTSEYINIDYPSNENFTIKLYDLSGRVIHQEKQTKFLDIKHLTNGTYFLLIESNNTGNIMIKKIIKIS